MNYGKSIVVAFILFAFFIGTLVTVCIRQDVSLVTPDYYQEELVHGEKMTALANANNLSEKPEIILSSNGIRVRYNQLDQLESGEIFILRPNDTQLDHRFKLSTSEENELGFPLNDYKPGLYRIQMKWMMDGKPFMIEQIHTQ